MWSQLWDVFRHAIENACIKSSGKKAHIITDDSMHGIVSRSGPGWSRYVPVSAHDGMMWHVDVACQVSCHVSIISWAA